MIFFSSSSFRSDHFFGGVRTKSSSRGSAYEYQFWFSMYIVTNRLPSRTATLSSCPTSRSRSVNFFDFVATEFSILPPATAMNPSGAKHASARHPQHNNVQQRASLLTAKLPHPDAATSQLGGAPAQTETTFISSPTYRDVLNGRGQGVQRHPGNVKYRALVYVNKVRQTLSSVHINYQLHSLPPGESNEGKCFAT